MSRHRPAPRTLDEARRARGSALVMASALAGMGAAHVFRPAPFDRLIPPTLPGPARAWTHGSGVAEVVVAALLAAPRTRRTGARAAQALFLGVWPGNVWMAWRWRHRPWTQQAVSLGRLPLQLPLIVEAGRIARATPPAR